MFTGIVQTIGTVLEAPAAGDGQTALSRRLEIGAAVFQNPGPDKRPIAVGDSVAVNGVCLTVAELDGKRAGFDLASETLRRTALGDLRPGSAVNLERSLCAADGLDGHIVQGHVDAVAQVLSIGREGQTIVIHFELPENLKPFVAPKGSIAVDGTSLTVGEVNDGSFSVYIIPHTAAATIAGDYKPGSRANLEADCIARYVVRALTVLGAPRGG